jgi:hypothetical protein
VAAWQVVADWKRTIPDHGDFLAVAIAADKVDPARDAVELGNVWKRLLAVGGFGNQRFLNWFGDVKQFALRCLRQRGHVEPYLILLTRQQTDELVIEWLQGEASEVSVEDVREVVHFSDWSGAKLTAFVLISDAWIAQEAGLNAPKRRAMQVLAVKSPWPQARCAWRVYYHLNADGQIAIDEEAWLEGEGVTGELAEAFILKSPRQILLNRYRVAKTLGGGGMKQVYLAEDLRLAERACVLAKMVDSFNSPEARRWAVDAFQREANLLAGLENKHIPKIYDTFSENNSHYLVMEYVDGTTLQQTLAASGGKLEERALVRIALQIVDALKYLHHLTPPVIHRDLKPSNVMITNAGRVKLIDFGIARHFQTTKTGTVIGTPGYAPPEQYQGKADVRSDLYALGATMHHALSGRDPTREPPFSFPPLLQLCPRCNPDLANLVRQALAYEINHRVASVTEFKRRLLHIANQHG